MAPEAARYVYGPVPSRRLGLSLGVDVVPLKTCSFNCIYCQLGRTTKTTVERRAYTPVEAVAADVATALRERPTPDFITISGSGEPTLHSLLGELIDRIRTVTHLPVAVITNGSLLWLAEVRADCAKADVVLPSLDAGDAEMFARINRPHPDITFERAVSGLAAFRREYDGQIWLEVFLVRGVNDTEEPVRAIARIVAEVKPDRVQLNTAVRPTAEAGLEPVSPERLAELAGLFDPPGEVIADYHRPHEAARESAGAEEVLAMLARRPATVEDLADGLGLRREEVMHWVTELKRVGRIGEEVRSGKRYYFPTAGARQPDAGAR
jgi:wyosine [tRNA(Phe)-imidazoG37] synthetase (radical SAM superfamily)